jgi:hypothetical protein
LALRLFALVRGSLKLSRRRVNEIALEVLSIIEKQPLVG